MIVDKLKKYFSQRMMKAFSDNLNFIKDQINNYCRENKNVKILDVGCGDGKITQKILNNLSKNNFQIYGIDVEKHTPFKGLIYYKHDLEHKKFPFLDKKFDIVYSNQVVEHLWDKDNFIKECFRVLKKNGLFILSTENIASIDNIVSLVFCQEPLSQNSSRKYQINSFFSPHYGKKLEGNLKESHKNVCSYFSLKRLAEINGQKNLKIISFGNINKLCEIILPYYNRLITIYGVKE